MIVLRQMNTHCHTQHTAAKKRPLSAPCVLANDMRVEAARLEAVFWTQLASCQAWAIMLQQLPAQRLVCAAAAGKLASLQPLVEQPVLQQFFKVVAWSTTTGLAGAVSGSRHQLNPPALRPNAAAAVMQQDWQSAYAARTLTVGGSDNQSG